MNSNIEVDAECLILSASKRSLDICVSELSNHVPDVVKSVANATTGAKRNNEVFRDDLLSFVSFQSVFWRDSPPAPIEETAFSPSVSDYLVLGYVNGIQVWRLQSPSSSSVCLPSAERVIGFRTLCPVDTAHLIPDLPEPFSLPSCRLAVVQKKDGSNNSVDIFSSSTHVHVIQLPWPILRVESSLSCSDFLWSGTLVVATTQQSVSLPPLWRWLAYVDCPSVISLRGTTSAEDQPKQKSRGPIFAVGSRWLVYQATPAAAQAAKQPEPINTPSNNGEDQRRPAWRRLLSFSAALARQHRGNYGTLLTKLSSAKLPRALDLLLDQAGAAGSLFPVVDIERGVEWAEVQHVQPLGGPIVIVDLISGQVVGHVAIGEAIAASVENVTEGGSSTEQDHFLPKGDDVAVVSEVQDGVWWLSHLECSDNDVKEVDEQQMMSSDSIPLMSLMRFDVSGTTLFCTDWSGRKTWACRLSTKLQSGQISAISVYELWRGCTVGSVVDVASSNNLIGESIVVIASSRGSGHCFALPMGFHQSVLDESGASLLFPASLYSSLPQTDRVSSSSTERQSRRTSSGDSSDEEDPQRSSDANLHPPRLELRPNGFSFTRGQKPLRRRPVWRINMAAKLEEPNFCWKISFPSAPFFRSPHKPNQPPGWSLRRSLKIPWPKQHLAPDQSRDTYLLPFLIASSDGVMDSCHAEFAGSGVREHSMNHELPATNGQQMIIPELVPRLAHPCPNEICILADDDCAVAIDFKEDHKPNVESKDTELPTWFPSSDLRFIRTTVVHSLSTRDMDNLKMDSPSWTVSHHHHGGFGWAQYCEVITAPHREIPMTIRLLSTSPEAAPELNRWFRSGRPVIQFITAQIDPKSSRLRCAIDAAINVPIWNSSLQSDPVPISSSFIHSNSRPPTSLTSSWPQREQSDDYVSYQY